MSNQFPALPIDDVLPLVREGLAAHPRAVLQAPPGAGKTTRVPLALLDEPWVGGRRIIMLEPRRLAARAAATFMARLLGDTIGGTVGYRVRLDSRTGPRTRIEVVTEGVLTRMLQDDPSLADAAVVIFDEFHERSLHADVGLALALQAQALLRPDLRILVMSATLDAAAVTALLDEAPLIRSEGRAHPVETVHLAARPAGRIEDAAAAATLRALDRHDGDVLVFLPGAAEIRRTAERVAERLAGSLLARQTAVLPLFGDLPQDAQDRAIASAPDGSRKVVLATAIAETSLTIEGVRTVVDSGLMRVPRFSPRTGMTRLVTVPVSRASADQRRGRAGRLGPGTCYRLWTEADHAGLLAHRPPEILEADLAPLALELAAWGVADPAELRWIDPPPAAAFGQARELLTDLDALDADGRITTHGRSMARLAMHPRLANMLLRATSPTPATTPAASSSTPAADGPVAHLACELAALLAERDVLRPQPGVGDEHGAAAADPDVRLRLPLLRGGGRSAHTPVRGHVVDRAALRRAAAEAGHWRRRLGLRGGHGTAAEGSADDRAGLLLAFAYPDRIGQARGGRGRYVLRNGRGAAVDPRHALAGEEFIVAAEVGGHGRDSRVFLGAPLARADLERHFAEHIANRLEVDWDRGSGALRARQLRRLGALVLGEGAAGIPAGAGLPGALLDVVRAEGPDVLEWSREAHRLRERLAFLHRHAPGEWPDVSDAALLATLEAWLLPWLESATGGDALRRVDPAEALLAWVGWAQRSRVDELAPTHVQVPSGSRIAIDYSDPDSPVLAVRLQELFGQAATPTVMAGRVPLTLHLLSPAQRPVQVTRDLASFWRNAYFDVRRDLRGRYPKHYWPDDPLEAEPTRRTRPRR
jgi:ATP-dependent helicase HrpB